MDELRKLAPIVAAIVAVVLALGVIMMVLRPTQKQLVDNVNASGAKMKEAVDDANLKNSGN